MTIGQRIAELRIARGWSQADLARESGVPVRTLQRLERVDPAGRPISDPAIGTARRIARALGVTIEELIG